MLLFASQMLVLARTPPFLKFHWNFLTYNIVNNDSLAYNFQHCTHHQCTPLVSSRTPTPFSLISTFSTQLNYVDQFSHYTVFGHLLLPSTANAKAADPPAHGGGEAPLLSHGIHMGFIHIKSPHFRHSHQCGSSVASLVLAQLQLMMPLVL